MGESGGLPPNRQIDAPGALQLQATGCSAGAVLSQMKGLIRETQGKVPDWQQVALGALRQLCRSLSGPGRGAGAVRAGVSR